MPKPIITDVVELALDLISDLNVDDVDFAVHAAARKPIHHALYYHNQHWQHIAEHDLTIILSALDLMKYAEKRALDHLFCSDIYD